MEKFICKIATLNEVYEKWNKRIEEHPNDARYIEWTKQFVNGIKDGTRICYYGMLENESIVETTAVVSIKDEGMQNKSNLIDTDMAYLMAFKTNPEYQNKGYFSILYRFMEEDLRKKGFQYAALGVEPSEVRNMKLYFNLGYDEYVKTDYEVYPAENEILPPQKILVSYYKKKIN
ncbi:MAG: GNAT family N-acetyltransferase [Bacilli bacterium]|nr:GNAT family N-acetyltransferase [Bacilli bacterium]